MKMLTGLAAADRGRGAAVRPAARRRRHERAQPRRLHVAVVLALYRTDGAAEPRPARAAVSSAGGARRRRASPSWSSVSASADYLDQRTLRPAARHSPAAVARRRDRARAGDADPRRADLGRRSAGARPVLGAADRSVAQPGRDDLRLDPFHERGRALRPHRR